MQILAFLLALGSALRLTRLAVTDTITQPFRTAIAMRYAAASALEAHTLQIHQHSSSFVARRVMRRLARRRAAYLWLVQLFECPWCIGFWISLVVAAIAVSPAATALPIIVLASGLSLSHLVGLVTLVESKLNDSGTD